VQDAPASIQPYDDDELISYTSGVPSVLKHDSSTSVLGIVATYKTGQNIESIPG
jgi:hypothetical protein